MDELFGIPTQQLTLTLLGAFAAVTLILAVLAMRERTSLRMAVRNLSRRRTQTLLIVAGLTLATVLFSAAFTTGDTLTNSLRAQALEDIGQVDVVVRAEQPASGGGAAFGPGAAAGSAVPEPRERYFGERLADEIEDRLASNGNVAGVAPLAKESVPVTSPETDLSEPRVDVLGVDGPSMGGFDPLRTASGGALAPGDLGKGEVYVSRETAEGLGVGRGDEVEASMVRDFGQPAEAGRPSVPGSGQRTEAPRSPDAGRETGIPPAGGRASGPPPSMPKGASGPGESKLPSRPSGPAA